MSMLIGTRRALLGGRKLINALFFNGTNTSVNCGSDAGIDDLPTGDFTIEFWLNDDPARTEVLPRLANKATADIGWALYLYTDAPRLTIQHVDTNAQLKSTATTNPGRFDHWAFVWDVATKNGKTFKNGLDVTGANTAGVGAYQADADTDLILGRLSWTGLNHFHGLMCWVRISDTKRYAANFAPPSRTNPPAVDGNTVVQYNFDEGRGTTLDNAEGTAARDGTISNGTWIKAQI